MALYFIDDILDLLLLSNRNVKLGNPFGNPPTGNINLDMIQRAQDRSVAWVEEILGYTLEESEKSRLKLVIIYKTVAEILTSIPTLQEDKVGSIWLRAAKDLLENFRSSSMITAGSILTEQKEKSFSRPSPFPKYQTDSFIKNFKI